MSLTKVSQSMSKDAPISVLDYSSLATTVSSNPGGASINQLFPGGTFLNWSAAIQAALDESFNRGGGTVILPQNNVPYYVREQIIVKSNTTFVCEDWIVLADYNATGGTFGANGDNILVINLQIDNSDVYAGGSGYNGLGAGGKNITFVGGYVKNCHRGVNSPFDGGKGTQIETGDSYDISFTDMTFENCHMAMSTIRDYLTTNPYRGIIYNNIIAYDCDVLFFVKQSNGTQVQNGLEHAVQLNNFYAQNCGVCGDINSDGTNDDGVIQLSRAANVNVSNGIVTTDGSIGTPPFIRGNHADCIFSNIQFYSNATEVILLDPSYHAADSSQVNANNKYDITVLGTVDKLIDSSISTSYRTLNNCTGSFRCLVDTVTAWFGYELRNGTSTFMLSQNNKTILATTSINYDTSSTSATSFADLDSATSYVSVNEFHGIASKFIAVASSSVDNNSVFLDSSTNKISFKDGSGTTHALY